MTNRQKNEEVGSEGSVDKVGLFRNETELNHEENGIGDDSADESEEEEDRYHEAKVTQNTNSPLVDHCTPEHDDF